jgi:hypothetical protein
MLMSVSGAWIAMGTAMLWTAIFRCIACCVVALTFASARPALAAEIAIVGNTITFSGDIKSGDLADLTTQVFKAQATKPRPLTLSLNSNGSNFDEAMLISFFVRQSGIRTLVKSGNRCNSACALIFLGGSSIEGGESGIAIDRNLEVGAELGFHLPFKAVGQPTPDTTRQGLSETEAIVQLTALFDKLEIPESIRDKLRQNDEIHGLYDATIVEALELLEINVDGLTVQPLKITSSMAINGCVNMFRLARKELPSATFPTDIAKVRSNLQTSPTITPDGPSSEFALVPTLDHNNQGVAICRLGAGGECQGFYWKSAMTNFTREQEQIEDLNLCQRQSNVSALVPPDVRLSRLDETLLNLQNQEQALLNVDPNTAHDLPPLMPDEGEEDAEASGDVTEDNAQPIPDFPEAPTQRPRQKDNYVVLPVGPSAEVICNDRQQFANVRAGPNSKIYPIVSTLLNQTQVTVVGNTKNPETNHPWYEVSFVGGRGFIDSELVKRTCLVALAPMPPSPPPIPQSQRQHREAVVCNADGDSANVRSAPNPKASTVLRKVFNNEPLTIIGEANNPDSGQLYFKVDVQGVIGYVDNELISPTCNLSNQLARRAGYMCNRNLSYTNMRSGPSPKRFAIIAQLNNNAEIVVIERTFNPDSGAPWYRIEASSQTGFVDATAVSEKPCNTSIEPQPVSTGEQVMCNPNASFTNLRMGPNSKIFDIISQMTNGTPIRILESTNNPETGHLWFKVENNGLVGFVDSEMVSATGC